MYRKGRKLGGGGGKKDNGNKRGLKRQNAPEKFEAVKKTEKEDRSIEDKADCTSPPSSPGDLPEEEPGCAASSGAEMYNSLLMRLQSTNASLAHAYRKRKRGEEGKSDSEEEEASDSGSLSISNDEIAADGIDDGSPRSYHMESKLQDPGTVGIVDGNDNTESEDDQDASDIDQEHNLDVNAYLVSVASTSMSPFDIHLGYKFPDGEADKQAKRKWKYTWDVPASDMPNCKWVGTGDCFMKDSSINPGVVLKPKLYKHWLDVYKKSGGDNFPSSRQRHFFSLCSSYRDILHSNKKPFYLKGLEEDLSVMDAYIMHSLNHIFKTRDLIKKNDSKVAKYQDSSKDELLADDGFLDHGFTRPKILILLPTRHITLRTIKRLIEMTPQAYKVNVEHFDRFIDEFGVQGDEEKSGKNSSKPSDYQALFVDKNNDDNFMLGIKFTRRSIKLYSDFYSSDMIVASPLKVHDKIAKVEINKEIDVDYLSSIEVLIIDHADVITMQNWAFLSSVLDHLNCIPSKQHGTDIMRIRKWYLEGHARLYRQTIVLSYYVNPDINALFNHQCVNYQGKVKLVCKYKGVLPKVLLQVRQIYERFEANLLEDVDDARLEYFTKKVFPKIKDSIQGGIMLFISSYFEYVRLRNFLKSQNTSFCLLSEYAKSSDISRARVWFFEGRKKIMLYTERAHFYHRYKIRGIRNLIIYSLPERKEFYPEVVNILEEAHGVSCTVLFSHFDQLRLERIVGSTSAKRMIASEKSIFVFC